MSQGAAGEDGGLEPEILIGLGGLSISVGRGPGGRRVISVVDASQEDARTPLGPRPARSASGTASCESAASASGAPLPGSPARPRAEPARAPAGSAAPRRRTRAGTGEAPAAGSGSEAASGLDEPVPARYLAAAARLRGGPPHAASGRERVARAWRAGLVARRALASGGGLSERTTDCGIANRVYIILRGPDGARRSWRPERFATFRAYADALGGEVSGGDHISHAWASLLEAEVYCEAAGVNLPPQATDL